MRGERLSAKACAVERFRGGHPVNREPGAKLKAALLFLGVMFLPWLIGCGSKSSSSTTSSATVNNTAQLVANFGPNGSNNGLINGIFTNITVCQHGTSNCATIDNVEVDTGSIGLRLAQGVLGSVTLSQILQTGSPLLECIQYGDTSYSWGPMALADVTIAGETASSIPVQLLGNTTEPVPGNCLTMPVNPGVPNGGNEDTVATLGASGILGIAGNNFSGDGEGIFDCGSLCTTDLPASPYYICPGNNCQQVLVATNFQAANPVASFSSVDKNGVMITFPPVAATGATQVLGTINFGVSTQTDNALGTAKVFAFDPCGVLPTVTFNSNSYFDTSCTGAGSGMGGFFDTGSTALYVLDANTLSSLGISDCPATSAGSGFYCVTGTGGTAMLSNIMLLGNGNIGSGAISLNIADATTLFTSNNAVFNNLGSDGFTGSPGTATDYFDFGAPFFFGRTVFVGIGGVGVINANNAPNGFVAF
jgi:hypothetical protein